MPIHTVKKGDTLWSIARMYGIGLNELLHSNSLITSPNFIVPGQSIYIPTTTPTNNQTYTVKPGDTMWQISTKHNIKLDDLLKLNPNINKPNIIVPGQTINISTPTTEPDIQTVPNTTSDLKTLETEVIKLVNDERTKAGRPSVTENNELSSIARLKSEDFIKNNYFSHNSPTYGTPFDMMRQFGINFTAAAENIASGQKTAEEVMETWMNSSGHRANVLNSTYNQIGVGVARDSNGNLYWTQMFIKS